MCCPTTTPTATTSQQKVIQRAQSPTSPMDFSSTTSSSSHHVSFDDNSTKVIVSSMSPLSSMSQDERSDLWYDAMDLNKFKTDARNLCRQLRDAQQQNADDCVRGLEQRVSLERQRNKCLTVRCILKAQQRYAGQPDQLAMIAAKCTAWAQQVAQIAAREDYQQVYSLSTTPSSSQQEPQPLVAFPLAAFQLKRKSCAADVSAATTSSEASATEAASAARRVRARVC